MNPSNHLFTPIDPGRVNSVDPVELDYWATRMDCSVEVLVAVIETVGEHVTEIRVELQRQGWSPH